MASLYSKRGKWTIGYKENGKRKMKITPLQAIEKNKPKALKIKEDIETYIENNFAVSTISINPTRILLKTGIKNIEAERFNSASVSKSHLNNFNITKNHFLEIVDKNIPIAEVTAIHIREFINKLKPNVSDPTLHTYIGYLRMLFNYFVEENYIERSPIKKSLIPVKRRTMIIPFRRDQEELIYQEAKKREHNIYLALKILSYTGLRPVDVLDLKVKDFDLEFKTIRVKTQKTKKEINIPLYDEFLSFVQDELAPKMRKPGDTKLFENLSVALLGKKFRWIKRDIGLENADDLNLKTFRKNFATRMAKLGLGIHEVATLLGHDSVKTTFKYYTDVDSDALRDKINSMKAKS